MFQVAAPAFLAIPNADNKRVLVEGQVKAVADGAVEIAFEQVAALSGGEVTLFAEVRGKFFQQAAVVAGEAFSDNRTTLTMTLIGDPVSAEQRGSFRTSAVMLNLPVGIDRMAGCVLADVSPEGIAVVCPKPLTVGSTVDVTLEAAGFKLVEKMRVQGVKVMPSGKLRFGLLVPGKRSPARRTLEQLAGHLQRQPTAPPQRRGVNGRVAAGVNPREPLAT